MRLAGHQVAQVTFGFLGGRIGVEQCTETVKVALELSPNELLIFDKNAPDVIERAAKNLENMAASLRILATNLRAAQ
jgi:signal transduction histidine kinase